MVAPAEQRYGAPAASRDVEARAILSHGHLPPDEGRRVSLAVGAAARGTDTPPGARRDWLDASHDRGRPRRRLCAAPDLAAAWGIHLRDIRSGAVAWGAAGRSVRERRARAGRRA